MHWVHTGSDNVTNSRSWVSTHYLCSWVSRWLTLPQAAGGNAISLSVLMHYLFYRKLMFCHSSYSSNSFCLKYSSNTLTLYTVCSMLPLIHTQLGKGGNALLLMYLNKLEQIVKLHSLTSFTSLSILKDCTYWSVPACSSTGLCWKRDLNLSKTLSK